MITVAALYQFKPFNSFLDEKDGLLRACKKERIKGTLLIGNEGINGTISGSRESILSIIDYIHQLGFDGLELKFSHAYEDPFLRMKVVGKKEIVTLGEAVDPCTLVGEYVDPVNWNETILQQDVLLIDTRNSYEYELGTFDGAVNPNTECFRDFPKFVTTIDRSKYRRIAMFCTGGIRCEKASSYMLSQGFEVVYHLKGGILAYLEQIDLEESLWKGDCFVFDRRVALGHGLKIMGYIQCFGCRRAIRPEDCNHPFYEEGVSCHHCYGNASHQQKKSYRERHFQIHLASEKGQQHLNPVG